MSKERQGLLMAFSKLRPLRSPMGRLLELNTESLLESVQHSLYTAREQVLRSTQIISHSHEIVGRSRVVLAHANRIKRDISGEPSVNPLIAVEGE